MCPIILRKMHSSDIPAVTALLNNYLSFGSATLEKTSTYLQKATVRTFVLEIAGNIQGFIKAEHITPDTDWKTLGYKPQAYEALLPFHHHKLLSLDLAAIHPHYQQQGYFEKLIQAICKKENYDYVIGLSWIKNEQQATSIQQKNHYTRRLPHYWAEDQLACDQCAGYCHCDALLWVGDFNH